MTTTVIISSPKPNHEYLMVEQFNELDGKLIGEPIIPLILKEGENTVKYVWNNNNQGSVLKISELKKGEIYSPPKKTNSICNDIMKIMESYREQVSKGYIDTPGGLEHMGDVWNLFSKWDQLIREENELENELENDEVLINTSKSDDKNLYRINIDTSSYSYSTRIIDLMLNNFISDHRLDARVDSRINEDIITVETYDSNTVDLIQDQLIWIIDDKKLNVYFETHIFNGEKFIEKYAIFPTKDNCNKEKQLLHTITIETYDTILFERIYDIVKDVMVNDEMDAGLSSTSIYVDKE